MNFAEYQYEIRVVLTCLMVVIGFIFLYGSFKFLKHARIIEDTPTAKIRSCAQGFVELEGTQYPHQQPQISPYSKTPCTWFHATVEAYQRHGKNSVWVKIDEVISNTPLLLKDGTGQCLILPAGAKVVSGKPIRWRGFSKKPKNGPSPYFYIRFFYNLFGRYQYTEYLLLPETLLYAIGMFETISDLSSPNQDPIHILSKQGLPKRRPFLLSIKPQKKVVLEYKLKASVATFCFFASIYVAYFILKSMS